MTSIVCPWIVKRTEKTEEKLKKWETQTNTQVDKHSNELELHEQMD